MAYEKIKREVNAAYLSKYGEASIRQQLNISFEWSVLIEAQHIVDELQMMQEVFTQQIVVVKDLERAMRSMGGSSASTLARAVQLIHDIEQRRDELSELEKHQDKSRAQVSANPYMITGNRTVTVEHLASRATGHQATAGRHHRGEGSHRPGGRDRAPGAFDRCVHRHHHLLRRSTDVQLSSKTNPNEHHPASFVFYGIHLRHERPGAQRRLHAVRHADEIHV